MTRQALSIRQEFGVTRSQCDCAECTISCQYVPGFLVPGDIWRLAKLPGTDLYYESVKVPLLLWAMTHLRASPGATVIKFLPTGPQKIQIPTLVPARQEDNRTCHWLSADKKCQVHADSPYGCAMMDSHKEMDEGMAISRLGLNAIIESMRNHGAYVWLWSQLDQRGIMAPGPNASRQKMKDDLGFFYPERTLKPNL